MTLTQSDINFIQTNPPFDCLNEHELARIEQTLQTVIFPRGTHILTQGGASSQYLYIIREGAVCLVRDGQEIMFLEEGEFFAYPSLINQVPPAFDVVAEENVTAYRVPEATFHELVDNADFAEFFLRGLGERLRRAFQTDASPLGGDLMTSIGSLAVQSLVMVKPEATVSEAARAMRQAWVDSALVSSDPPGIITDSNFMERVLAEGLGPDTPVHKVMSYPLKTLPETTPVHGALLFMLDEQIHHLPLTRGGEIVGIVTATDLLRHQAKSPLYITRYIEKLKSPAVLPDYALEVAATVKTLYEGGLDIAQIGRVIASLNDILIRRLLRFAEEKLGPPPTPYAWLVFGSEGRMEQLLLTDQDNALAYLEDTDEAKEYFAALTEHVINNLIRAGFPPCPGGYMATKWHQPLAKWLALFEGWIITPKPQALLESAIFFDFRSIYGDLSVEPLEQIMSRVGDHKIFLSHLTRAALEFQPPLGFFRRIRSDEEGKVDLKLSGVAPIVALARVYAFEAYARTRTTFDRLQSALEAGTLSENGAETLTETYRFLLQLRLQQQLATLKAGGQPDNKIELSALSQRDKRHLKEAFMAIREMQEAASQRFHTGLLG